jgi:meso-butanediol dehydrogenase / (S,S)-butanediol dehydrogenase / diacetyl reductase
MRLKGRVSIVTGGASGIGLAAVKLFAREGSSVVVSDINKEAALEVVDEVKQAGGEVIFVYTDVSSEESVIGLMDAAKKAYGKIDVLFNNAGITIANPVTETSIEDFETNVNINLKGVFLGCKHAIPHMNRKRGGSIINTASILALVASPNQASYSASKGGVVALTRQVAYDYADKNIRVNCICPADTKTPMHYKWLQECENPEETLKFFSQRFPMKRFAEPEEQASVALFLASDESSFITGQAIPVDGGLSIW